MVDVWLWQGIVCICPLFGSGQPRLDLGGKTRRLCGNSAEAVKNGARQWMTVALNNYDAWTSELRWPRVAHPAKSKHSQMCYKVNILRATDSPGLARAPINHRQKPKLSIPYRTLPTTQITPNDRHIPMLCMFLPFVICDNNRKYHLVDTITYSTHTRLHWLHSHTVTVAVTPNLEKLAPQPHGYSHGHTQPRKVGFTATRLQSRSHPASKSWLHSHTIMVAVTPSSKSWLHSQNRSCLLFFFWRSLEFLISMYPNTKISYHLRLKCDEHCRVHHENLVLDRCLAQHWFHTMPISSI